MDNCEIWCNKTKYQTTKVVFWLSRKHYLMHSVKWNVIWKSFVRTLLLRLIHFQIRISRSKVLVKVLIFTSENRQVQCPIVVCRVFSYHNKFIEFIVAWDTDKIWLRYEFPNLLWITNLVWNASFTSLWPFFSYSAWTVSANIWMYLCTTLYYPI